MKRTWQPNKRKRAKLMVSALVWQHQEDAMF